jgi:hypothetical protein
VLFLAESIVSALGEGNVHIRPGYGTGDILFLVIQIIWIINGLRISG